MNDNEGIVVYGTFVFDVKSDGFLGHPIIESLDNNVLHIPFRQNMVNLVLGCAKQVSTFSGLEK